MFVVSFYSSTYTLIAAGLVLAELLLLLVVQTVLKTSRGCGLKDSSAERSTAC